MGDELITSSKIFKIIIFKVLFILWIMSKIKKRMPFFKGAAICMIAKDENLYIKEFVKHYKNLGFKKIFLYDNNDLNGENFTNVLDSEMTSKFVEITDIRGKQKHQYIAYNDCYQKHLNNYSWFLLVDTDEFLYIKNNISLNEFLNNPKFKKCQSISINYKEFGDSDLFFYDNRTVQERFKINFRYIACMKSFVKGGIKRAIMDIHRPYNIKKFCNSEGKFINPKDYATNELEIKSAEIRHYITKSLNEFYKRLIKGWPHVKYNSSDYYYFVDHRIEYFFNLNKITREKFNLLSPLIKSQILLNNLIKQLNDSEKLYSKYKY